MLSVVNEFKPLHRACVVLKELWLLNVAKGKTVYTSENTLKWSSIYLLLTVSTPYSREDRKWNLHYPDWIQDVEEKILSFLKKKNKNKKLFEAHYKVKIMSCVAEEEKKQCNLLWSWGQPCECRECHHTPDGTRQWTHSHPQVVWGLRSRPLLQTPPALWTVAWLKQVWWRVGERRGQRKILKNDVDEDSLQQIQIERRYLKSKCSVKEQTTNWGWYML